MPNGIISESQFKEMTDINLKLNILFGTNIKIQKTLEDSIAETKKRVEIAHQRFEKIEKKALKSQLKDKGFAGMMGLVGGFIAGWFRIH